MWIWDGNGNDITCPMTIEVQQNFTIQCLNQPLTFYVWADDWYYSNLNGASGYGTIDGDPTAPPQTYIISTTNVACGN